MTKTNDITVAYGNIGSAIKLKYANTKRNDGSRETYKLLWALCRNNKISNILLLSRSDYTKLSEVELLEIDPSKKIIECYKDIDAKYPKKDSREYQDAFVEALLNNPICQNIDFGLFYTSQGFAATNIADFLYKKTDNTQKAKQLAMTSKYSGCVVHAINRLNFPWYLLNPDPRYLKHTDGRDLMNEPIKILGQWSNVHSYSHASGYDDPHTTYTTKIDIVPSGIEKINLINEPIISPDNIRDLDFAVVSMQSTPTNSIKDHRFEAIKKWVLDFDNENKACIYGKWDNYYKLGGHYVYGLKAVPKQINDNEMINPKYSQFKGYLGSDEIDEIFKRTKYTLVIPVVNNFLTSKYAEMLLCGCLPFVIDSNECRYDSQYNVIPENSFMRVKTPQEMHNKMQYLNANDNKRIQLVKCYQDNLIHRCNDGYPLFNYLNARFAQDGLDIRLVN